MLRSFTILMLMMLAISTRAEPPGYHIETLAEGLNHPWAVAFLPGEKMLITERGGTLKLYQPAQPMRTIDGVPPAFVSGQAGLFDVLPAEDFARSRTIYLSLAHGDERANHARIVAAELHGERLHNVRELFTSQPAKRGSAHYGARMAWLPDGTLVMGLGDGFDYREQAQRLDSHLGKIIRITADGSIPADNPFADQPEALPEIYSLGHRNVQGLVVDAARGLLWAHEHGPRGGDELNLIEPGGNYGWPLATHGVDYTGARISPYRELPGLVPPRLVWTPSIAPAGLALYEGELFPGWQGSLLVAALAERSVRRVTLGADSTFDHNGIEHKDADEGTGQELLFTELGERLRDVRVGPEGALYLLTDSAEGRLLRITPATQSGSANTSR